MSKQYVERKSNASRAPHVRTELIHTANTAFADALGRWPTLASLQPARQAKQMLALVAACNASACFALHLCASVASPLRLSGEPPDSRRGGAVRSNLSRRASCEAARESRGSHAAGLNEAWRWSACGENVQFLVQDFALGWSTRCPDSTVRCACAHKSIHNAQISMVNVPYTPRTVQCTA